MPGQLRVSRAIAVLAVAVVSLHCVAAGSASDSSEWAATTASGLKVVVNTTTGLYAVYNGDTKWFDSDPATAQAVHVQGAWYGRTTGGPITNLLHASGAPTTASGTDGTLGDFQEIAFLWTAGSTPFNTSIRVYTSADNILFRQHFPAGASGTSLGSQTEPISAFPSFQSSSDTLLAQLRYLTWEYMWDPGTLGTIGANLSGYAGTGVPLVLMDPAQRTVVMSPASGFKIALLTAGPTASKPLVSGIEGLASSIPAGFTYDTILVGGSAPGVVKRVKSLGENLLTRGGKGTTSTQDDIVSTRLGYYTDNGAYYYYYAGPDTTSSYQTLLPELRRALLKDLPVAYIQLDSFWYIKGEDHGVASWTPRLDPDAFPSGSIPSGLGPLQLHNRYWSNNASLYYKDVAFMNAYGPDRGGTDEAFPATSPPGNLKTLFSQVMAQGVKWGMQVYEQDWLEPQYGPFQAAHTDVNTGREWLAAMDAAASDAHVTILYCMPEPADYLASTEFPSVYHIRVSDDYWTMLERRKPTWNIGINSMLAWAVGLNPTKDTFWSARENPGYTRPGEGLYNTTEPHPALEVLASTLSAGQVAFGDSIGQWDTELLMRSCDDAGNLLRADTPLVPIDRTFLAPGASGSLQTNVTVTHSHVDLEATYDDGEDRRTSPYRSHIVLVSSLSAQKVAASLTVADLWPLDAPPSSVDYVVVQLERTGVHVASVAGLLPPVSSSFNPTSDLALTIEAPNATAAASGVVPYALVLAAPTVDVAGAEWAFLGDAVGKYVPVSAARFSSLVFTVAEATCTASGQAGETVTAVFLHRVSASSAFSAYSASCALPQGKSSVVLRVASDGTPSCASSA